jgi:type II secretory pathway component GspD/PulD (secretin)
MTCPASQSTAEVTTSMPVDSGQTVFIGGLITRNQGKTREGVPILGDIPVLGSLFSNKLITSQNTELVVLVTPYLIDNDQVPLDGGSAARMEELAQQLEEQPRDIDRVMEKRDYFEDTLEATGVTTDFHF